MDCIKIKNFSSKDNIAKTKKQAREQKILIIHLSNKRSVFRTYKEFPQINNEKADNHLEKRAEDLTSRIIKKTDHKTTEKVLVLHQLPEKCELKSQCDAIIQAPERLKFKTHTVPNAGEDVQQLELRHRCWSVHQSNHSGKMVSSIY